MRTVTQPEIKEIAQQFDCRFKCFLNLKNNKLVFIPDEDNGFIDMEFWQEETTELDNDFENFREIDRPNTKDYFKMMESFVQFVVEEKNLKSELYIILNGNKPFRNFKFKIDNSEYRENWFAFKTKWIEDYVQTEVDLIFEHNK